MQLRAHAYLVLGGGGCSKRIAPSYWPASLSHRRFTPINVHRNHYDVLGVSPNASSSDIKKAYRLLALKYHPDVNKEVGANEDFMSIRLAYDVLKNETSRSEYDRALHHQSSRSFIRDEWATNSEYEDVLRFYKWSYQRRKIRYEKYWEQNRAREEQSPFDDDEVEVEEVSNGDDERGSLMDVVGSAFICVFLMQTVGIRLSLTYSSLMALTDRKLDGGYKLGYLIAWILGGRVGIILTMFLSFASWICGKTNSSIVALAVVVMWFGTNVARFAPIPQGALLTLLYMSIKLQIDLT